MSPRPYQPGKRRQAATEATRSRIIEAARALLADPQASTFSIDAIAQRADVARMTVYYQFKSKAKLLEALFDDLAARANMSDLRKAFQEPDPRRGLNILIDVFCRFWESQGALLRRLNALAALDPEVDEAMTERGTWRREAIAQLLSRTHGKRETSELVDLLHVLTSFETHTAMAAHDRKKIAPVLHRAAAALLAGY